MTDNTDNKVNTESGSTVADLEEPTLIVQKGTSGFVGGMLALSSGALITQCIQFLSSLVISRLYNPEALGYAGVFFAIVEMIVVLVCLSYQFTIVLPKRDEDAANLLVLCSILVTTFAGFTALAMGVFGSRILYMLELSNLESYKWLIPVAVFANGIVLPLRFWNTRNRHFKRLGLVRVEAALINLCAITVLGFLGYTAGGQLVIAKMIGYSSVGIILGWYLLRYDWRFVLASCTRRDIVTLAKRYKKFPLVTSWAAILNTGTLQLPYIVVAYLFDPVIVGFYVLAKGVLVLPRFLIAQAVGQVFLQHAGATRAEGGNLAGLLEKSAKGLITLGLLPMLILALAGKDLFHFVFGERWCNAGFYASILALAEFPAFVAAPLSGLFQVLERQGLLLFLNIFVVIARIGILALVGFITKDIVWALLFSSMALALVSVLQTRVLVGLAGANGWMLFRYFLLHMLYAIPSIGIIGFFKWWFDGSTIYVLLACVLAVPPYLLLIFRNDQELSRILSQVWGRVINIWR
ncbi:MAG: oligosaccharide flippase family protein [Planctomycetota bacterium]|nr:MAG: oligosaccharide flippase family protein [Planctomycetota bacterium]